MLRNKINILFIVFCITLIATPLFALDFEPGQYEVTSKIDIPGMPATMPPQTMVQCITDQDPVPSSTPKNKDCKITDLQQTKTTVSWKMECVQQGQKITSTGNIIYKGDTFKGTIQANLGANAGNMIMTTMVTGKRISDCE